MRHRTRFVLATTICVLSLTVSVAGASAAEWHVAGKSLVGSSSLATGKTGHFNMSAAGVSIVCGGMELKGAKITAPAGGSVEHLVLTGCEVVDTAGEDCVLPAEYEGVLESKPLTVTAALGSKSPEDTFKIKPTSGTTFMEFTISGTDGDCFRLGQNVISGQLTEAMPKGREELATQEIKYGDNIPGELKWGQSAPSVNDSAQLKLTSGQAWSFH